jgi:hypothetical protein
MINAKSDSCSTHNVSTFRKSLFEKHFSSYKDKLSKYVKPRLERKDKL